MFAGILTYRDRMNVIDFQVPGDDMIGDEFAGQLLRFISARRIEVLVLQGDLDRRIESNPLLSCCGSISELQRIPKPFSGCFGDRSRDIAIVARLTVRKIGSHELSFVSDEGK